MEGFDRKNHWENVYQNKGINEVSWFQATPETSLQIIDKLGLAKDSKVIDAGGGDSLLVDYLLSLGYTDITVLDISKSAIEKAKERLGERASAVKWIVADIVEFKPKEKYDLWHDRAVFHFLTKKEEILKYRSILEEYVESSGFLVMGTFSDKGPKKCSGITVFQYTEESMASLLDASFEKLECFTQNHLTPFDTIQNFTFCSFKKKKV